MKIKLLLLHGALGSKKQFQSIKSILSDEFEIYDLNFEGHGGVESSKDFSIQLFTENVYAFLEKENLTNINIFGYSMGGYVALNVARLYPNKVTKIVTLGTKFDWNMETASKEASMLNPKKIEEKIPHYASKLKEEHHPMDWKMVMKKTAQMMIDLAERKSLKPNDFKRLTQEVFIGIGSEDAMVTYQESELVAQLIPKGRLLKIEGFPHPIDKIDPTELASYIKNSFL